MLNPVHSSHSRAGLQRYKAEPYVVAADVYAAGAHVGRGGWTWYTGSAAWMYRAGLESILGLRMRGDHLHMVPCIPANWPNFEISLKYQGAHYEINVHNPDGVQRGIVRITLDNVEIDPVKAKIPLQNDAATHVVHVTLGKVVST
jgi:cyclic beta-1,2-glucan synthetase